MGKLKQVAAIPVRTNADGELQVLLVTSRETQRWVVPKGWPWPKLANYKAAAGEAWEEAGVRGLMTKAKLGSFQYDKRQKRANVPVKVLAYLMTVTEQARKWPESAQRRRAWFNIDKAADAVVEPELKKLILSLADSLVDGDAAPGGRAK
jgi:8-oxo-dGTP pyrophosphatase MutT (NUDIX family)